MQLQDITLVQSSFAAAFARKAELAERFYLHLFRMMPEARDMFHSGFIEQKAWFLALLAATVKSLPDEASLADVTAYLARAHAHCELSVSHALVARRALLSALEDVLPGGLSEEEVRAWNTAVTRVTRSVALQPRAAE